MYLDVVDLKDFYSGPLGQVVQRIIGRKLREIWPDVHGDVVMGLGYAGPYLHGFLDEADSVAAFMPAAQGVVNWPANPPFRTALVDPFELPLVNGCVDRMLIVHALEMSESAHALLREAWRVLAPGGRLIIVVPNRRGLWARIDNTPFGHGQPFSRPQLTRILRDAMFSPGGWIGALHMPPTNWRFMLRSAAAWERLGASIWGRFAGVNIVEAHKQVYMPLTVDRRRVVKRLKPALGSPLLDGSQQAESPDA
ncbi:MAG: class I SAM-dependent methyltransferase [Fimbriimonadaceae bacterium]|nr:class I SAM-dependent methyltransferase [Alphaproteobacteria bacterium]